MTKSTQIESLLAEPPGTANAERILDWFSSVEDRIDRGDLMLGLLTVGEVEKVPAALEQAAAADPAAWVLLAEWLKSPPLDDPDLEAADGALARALAAGVEEAGLELAELRWFHRRDEASEEERQQAYRLVEQATSDDPEDGEAFHLLGLLTTGGFGVPADPTRGFELQKRAAELGSSSAEFECYVHLSTGLGVEVDEQAAFEFVKRAAEAEHPRAQYNMGAFYAIGKYVDADTGQAVAWYEKACRNDNGRACATLGAMYYQGEEVPQDVEKAAEYFELAEHAGFDPTSLQEAVGFRRSEDEWDEDDEEDLDDDDDLDEDDDDIDEGEDDIDSDEDDDDDDLDDEDDDDE